METVSRNWDNALPKEYIINELIVRGAMALAIGGVVLFLPPFERRVQPEDWAQYRYPFTQSETFPALPTALILVGMPIVNLIYFLWLSRKSSTRKDLLREATQYLLALSLSLLSVILLCEVIKRMYGRPRPDFLSRCYGTSDSQELMTISQAITSSDPLDCSGSPYSKHTLEDGRMSFPSEHSATSFSVFTMMAEWDFIRMKNVQGYGAEALVLPIFLLIMPLIIAISRTSDYRHHATDVLAGIFLGALIATGVTYFYFKKAMRARLSRFSLAALGGETSAMNEDMVDSPIDVGTTYRDEAD